MKLTRNILISSVLLLLSCQKQDGINIFRPIDSKGWSTYDTLTFDVPASSQLADYDITFQARITHNYAYKDLWLVIEQNYCDTICEDTLTFAEEMRHSTYFTDTVHLAIVDQDGNFTGTGREFLQYSCPVRFVKLKEGMHGTLHIHHIMSDHIIEGIHDIGIEMSPLLQSIAPSIDAQQDEQQ